MQRPSKYRQVNFAPSSFIDSTNLGMSLLMEIVIPAKSPEPPDALAAVGLLQDYLFYESISTASPMRIREAGAKFNQWVPRLTHDGIDLGTEKASEIHYCDGGKWRSFTSGD